MRDIIKSFKKNNRNMRGFSLVEVVLASGLLGALTLIILQQNELSNRSIKGSELSTEITLQHARVSSMLMDSTTCEANFKTHPATSTYTSLKRADGVTNIISVGDKFANGAIEITGISTKDVLPTRVDLMITYQKNRDVFGAKTDTKSMPLTVTKDALNNIVSCDFFSSAPSTDYDEVAKEVCLRVPDHKWNAANKQCLPYNGFGKVISFTATYNGATWVISNTRVISSNDLNDYSAPAPVVLSAVIKVNNYYHKLRLDYKTYFLNSSEVLSAQFMAEDFQNMKLTTPDIDGLNLVEVYKSDDSSGNDFVAQDRINFIIGI